MKTTEITNTADIIDSRDVIARVDDLTDDLIALVDDVNTAEDAEDRSAAFDALAEWLGADPDEMREVYPEDAKVSEDPATLLERWHGSATATEEADELRALLALAGECEGYGDWHHGEVLIRDSYFTEYAEYMASDIADYDPRNCRWPFTCIDWDKAADDLKDDYREVDFDGVAYWIRD